MVFGDRDSGDVLAIVPQLSTRLRRSLSESPIEIELAHSYLVLAERDLVQIAYADLVDLFADFHVWNRELQDALRKTIFAVRTGFGVFKLTSAELLVVGSVDDDFRAFRCTFRLTLIAASPLYGHLTFGREGVGTAGTCG